MAMPRLPNIVPPLPNLDVLEAALQASNDALFHYYTNQRLCNGEFSKLRNLDSADIRGELQQVGERIDELAGALNRLTQMINQTAQTVNLRFMESREEVRALADELRRAREASTRGFREFQETMTVLQKSMATRSKNALAMQRNSGASDSTSPLSPLYSTSVQEQYIAQLNEPIPGFPATYGELLTMKRFQLSPILEALELGVPPGRQAREAALCDLVRDAIGIVRVIPGK